MRAGEAHSFSVDGTEFLYLVPSGSIFALEGIAKAALDRLRHGEASPPELAAHLSRSGFTSHEIEVCFKELADAGAIVPTDHTPKPVQVPPEAFPLQRLVLNVTNQCNLACGYCYEYSDDRIAKPDGKPKYMNEETAHQAVDLLFREAAFRKVVHVTFFGGETLLNFPLMRSTVLYTKEKAAAAGKYADFSLTTNATLLTEEIIDFFSEHRIGITVSIDGDKELHDRMRVFHSGKGSYDVIAPKIKELLRRHRTNSIGARVTLSSGVREVVRIYRHLTGELGFDSVGFSPATANPNRLYSIGPQKMSGVLGEFETLAWEYRDHAVAGKQHGFNNISDTLKELHTGISKAYPCGAGLGLLGVSTSGNVGLCHRFADAEVGQMGDVRSGIDATARSKFLETHHLGARPDCGTCWSRPTCAGGCYHEAFVHYGSTSASNLHYCEWIKGWNDLCLRIYGEISLKNGSFLDRFNDN